MIKICHIANHITGKSDGVYAHLKMIFKNYNKGSFQHYLIFQGGEKIEKELSEMGIIFFVSKSLKKKISLKAFIDIYRFIKENNVSVIHAHFIKPYAIAGLINVFLRKRFIFNYHGLFIFNNAYYNPVEKIIYWIVHVIINLSKAVHVVLVPSKKSKELLLEETKLFTQPVVYYNGCDINTVIAEINYELYDRIKKIKKDKIIIALVGRLEIEKRIDRALNILKNIISEFNMVHLLIFGDGKLEYDLRQISKKLSINGYIDFLGYVENIDSYFKLFDVVLFTSASEGMPLTVWEAMVNEIPVLAPDVGGFKEIVEDNNCGVIYPESDMKDAEGKLIKLLKNKDLREKLGKNGKNAIEMKYNSRNFIHQIENIYYKLIV